MAKILITRYTIQQLRQLRSAMNNRVIPEILHELSIGANAGNHILLKYQGIGYRKRALGSGGYLRLFFDDYSPDYYKIIAAVLRDDDTYDQNFDALPRDPCYLWDGETGLGWDWFINEGYLYSAQLSAQQLQDAQEAVDIGHLHHHRHTHHDHPDHHYLPYHSTISQSAPGTGKTLTAAEKACELAEAGQNVAFLLPEALIDQQVVKYRCVKQLRQQPAGQNLFIGTFHQWLAQSFPQLLFQATFPDTELECLQRLAQQKRHWDSSGRDPITYRDVLLYQLYVINADRQEDDIYHDNQNRIKELEDIRPQWWQEAWGNEQLCRRDYALEVLKFFQEKPFAPLSFGWGTAIIADEAQDYLVEEIEIIKQLCHHWTTEYQHPVNLWLLGDINQRIAPVDFTWPRLQLNKLQELEWVNYRTTEAILTLANRFQERAKQARNGERYRWLPKPTDPQWCFERPGSAVKLLVYPDLASAETFLDPLVEMISQQVSGWQEKHSLQWRLAARARLFCSDNYHVNQDRVKFLEFMPVSQAKGREFDACIAFCLFDLPQNGGRMEAYTKWYTQLTRARNRLLIVATKDQLDNLGQDIFTNIPLANGDGEETISAVQWLDYQDEQQVGDALRWITELASSLDSSKTGRQGLSDIILEGLWQTPPIIYYDLYQVLAIYNFTSPETMAIEADIVNHLFAQSVLHSSLAEYLQRSEVQETLRLEILIYRCLGQSWRAAEEAQQLKYSDPTDYQEIMAGIYQDLQHRGLLLESKRLANFYGLEITDGNFNHDPWMKQSGKLLPLLKTLIEQKLNVG